jgi:hypothetical protein
MSIEEERAWHKAHPGENRLNLEVIPLRPGEYVDEDNPCKVRITHLPTGIMVESLDGYSTFAAGADAFGRLNAELVWQRQE